MYDQLLWRIRESLWNIYRLVNTSENYWTCQNVPRPKNTFVCLEYEKSGNLVPNFETFEKYQKDAHTNSVQNGCDASPNELMRFRFEAKPIWDTIQKHCTNAVIFLNMALTFYFKINKNGTF